MREVLRVVKDRDADVAAWLEVIDQFDHAVAARSPLDELARLASDITGLTAGVRDDWNRVRAEAAAGVLDVDESVGADIAHAVAAQRVRGRTATEISTPRGPALVSVIDLASGRIGSAWLLADRDPRWEPTHHLVVERLAGAVAARTLEARKQRARTSSFDPAAVERLLIGGLTEDEQAQAARHARLSASDRYAAIAVAQPGTDPESLAALAEATIADHGLAARRAVIGRSAAVVARAGEGLPAALDELAAGGLGVGVGDVAGLAGLPASWSHAREALALRAMVAADGAPVHFEQLGVLHLLARIPREAVRESPLFRALDDPSSHRGSPSDIEVLQAYVAEGTLRRAGERVFLHHTTVQHRLKNIETRLGVDLHEPLDRFRVQLAVRLLAIDRSTAA